MKTIKNNILNLTEILDSCKKSNIDNFIYASSLYVFIVKLAHFIEPQNNVQKYW